MLATRTRPIARPYPFILEPGGARTISGSDPFRVILAKGDRVTDWRADRKRLRRADPFDVLREALAEHRSSPGGAVGYFGYDLARRIERLPARARDDRGFPDLYLAFYDRIAPAKAVAAETGPALPGPVLRSNFTRRAYEAAIRRIREYIAAGDVYQVNLSQRFHARTTAAPLDIYRRLRQASPAPWSAFLQFGRRAIVSSSPELFLQVRGRRVVTRPIKGTRPRGATIREDQRLRAELLGSEKDNAELAMIVDLERNDLGRVCEYGSVKVTEPLVLESHPTVHHLVATVEGRLRKDVDTVDLLRATFPSGSVTGAPKIRAMEIIDELEPTRRAAYTGAIGFLGFDGSVSLSVAIRIIEIDGPDLWFQVGGGIVADSDPAREYEETIVKGTAMARALGVRLPSAFADAAGHHHLRASADDLPARKPHFTGKS